MIVTENTEITEVSVLVVNQSIKHQHTADLFCEHRTFSIVVFQTFLKTARFYNSANRDVGNILVCK